MKKLIYYILNFTFHSFANSGMGEGHWNLDDYKIVSQIISKKVCKSFE